MSASARDLFAAAFEPGRFEVEITIGDRPRHPAQETAKRALVSQRERGASPPGEGNHGMLSMNPHARCPALPGETAARVERRDLPHCRRESRLTDESPAADT